MTPAIKDPITRKHSRGRRALGAGSGLLPYAQMDRRYVYDGEPFAVMAKRKKLELEAERRAEETARKAQAEKSRAVKRMSHGQRMKAELKRLGEALTKVRGDGGERGSPKASMLDGKLNRRQLEVVRYAKTLDARSFFKNRCKAKSTERVLAAETIQRSWRCSVARGAVKELVLDSWVRGYDGYYNAPYYERTGADGGALSEQAGSLLVFEP